MYNVNIEKQCRCVKRSDYSFPLTCNDKLEALKKANEIIAYMNENFCQKHEFNINENGNEILISVKEQEFKNPYA